MKKSTFLIIISALSLITAVIAVFNFNARKSPSYKNLDNFAKCLTEKNIVMYGADWCLYCQSEKKDFGDSFKYILYIECPKNPELCLQKGVENYPTWILASGEKLVGRQGPEKLSAVTGCNLK